MTINLQKPDITELKPRITVFGVGGGGGNAVNNMINAGLQGVDFVVANTDAQALSMTRADRIIQMGVAVTEGLGAGSQPEVGRAAAEECIDEIVDHLSGTHMCFVTAGMGGGTGTGAAPVVAAAARNKGILTVGVVTKPFHFEGQRRMRIADFGHRGTAEVRRHADRHPEPEPLPHRERQDDLRRRLRHGRPGALFGRRLHHRPDGQGRPDQPRLRRRPLGDARDGPRDDGHGRGVRRGPRNGGGRSCDRQPAARRDLDEGRAGPADLDHRRPRPDAVRGGRGRDAHPRGGRPGRQHHPRRHLRRGTGRPHPRLRRRHRHRPGGGRLREPLRGASPDGPSGCPARRRCRAGPRRRLRLPLRRLPSTRRIRSPTPSARRKSTSKARSPARRPATRTRPPRAVQDEEFRPHSRLFTAPRPAETPAPVRAPAAAPQHPVEPEAADPRARARAEQARMPNVEDFPPVVRAEMERHNSAPAAAHHQDERGAMGLLKRITNSLGRREDEGAHDMPAQPARPRRSRRRSSGSCRRRRASTRRGAARRGKIRDDPLRRLGKATTTTSSRFPPS